ncbi:thiol reductant ABC exporter subunit CydC [Paenibacillus montaniterrae]|uniref:Thiol reductant ABC exporter subunit CydC n=1 Tax=Paenibacillus montaniterrae TaxID=429341 RepID=A0A920CZL1_9BACL|nr:thiol reductant ABC exporter subunit CydC [Paenibacillus montaniterrae]GIP18590.1 thiol reductant ABC exporter subunit CydC [Paenibacillus montaniterrae]
MKELALLTKALIQERKDIALSIICGFIAGIAGVVLFAASGYLISQTVFAPPLYTLIVLTSLVKILGLLRAASRYGERLYSHRATFSMLGRLRASFFARLVPLMPNLLGKKRSGELLARIVGDVESLQHYFLRVAYPPMIVVMVFLATVLFVSAYSVWVACLLIAGMLATAFVVPGLVLLGQRRVHGKLLEQRAAVSIEVTELLYGFVDLKVYGRLKEREEQLHISSDALVAEQHAAARGLLRGQSLHTFVTYLISWGVLALGAYLTITGSLEGVFIAMLLLASQTLFEEAAPLANLPAYKQDSEYAAKRLAETVHEDSTRPPGKARPRGKVQPRDKAQSPGKAQPPGKALSAEQAASIELCELSFHYEHKDRPVLKNISLSIPPGCKAAIVGPSGSGKTTIFELLLKLRASTGGEIRLNGAPITELDEASIWHAANVVLQRGHFFRGTIRDNLLLDGEQRSDEELMTALEKVLLSHKALDDEVYEKGENLSDGEKQRLALARAMLRKGRRLWLLDEPTSSLDYITEQHVFQQLLTEAADDTLLIICHRLTGLEEMDLIVVLEHGSVIEAGTYAQLMEQKGYFYEMKQIELQMIGDE